MDGVVVCTLKHSFPPDYKLHAEEHNEEERKLLDLIYTDDWKRRLRSFSMLFPLSVVVLFPIFFVHTTAFRSSQVLNETTVTHFYGFAATGQQVIDNMAIFHGKFAPTFTLALSGNFSSRIGAYGEATLFFLLFKLVYPPFAVAECFPKIGNDHDFIEVMRSSQILTGDVWIRVPALRTTALLLAFVQESVPVRQRAFATSIFCAADALLNCFSYFYVERFFERRPVHEIHHPSFLLPFHEFAVLFVLHQLLVTLSEKKRFDPPYYFINYYNAVLEKGSPFIRADQEEWFDLQDSSFRFYWNVDLRAVRSEIFEHLTEEKCILPMKCRDHGCDGSALSYKVLAIQLLSSVLLFPCLFVLRNLKEVFEQFGYSPESSKNFTELFYIGYATSSLLAIILPTIHSRFNTLFFSALGSLSCMCMLIVLHYLYLTTATLYAECLFYTLSLFFIINSAFLVPTAWTIIGEVTGKHRLFYLHIIVFFHMILWNVSDQFDKTYATTPVFCTIILLYVIALSVFYCFHGVLRELTSK